MEMNFPHPVSPQRAVSGRKDHKAMLAQVIARQANSRTARFMMRANRTEHDPGATKGEMLEQMIHYFGSHDTDKKSPSGAFWTSNCGEKAVEQNTELGVYQNASTNVKTHHLDVGRTGEQGNRPTMWGMEQRGPYD
ncbi:MAG: hypothetical protein ABI668_14035 [Sphingorhabdus sp.]